MAVTAIIEVYEGRTGTVTDSGDREATRHFSVQTDSGTTGVVDVLQAELTTTRIPRWGEPYVSEDGTRTDMRVKSVTARPDKSPTLWRVEVKYSSKLDTAGGSGSAGSGDGGSGDTSPNHADDGGGEKGGPGGGGGGGAGGGTGGGASGNPQQIDNPLLRPAEISYSAIKQTRVVEKAVYEDPNGAFYYGEDPDVDPGVAVVNTANDPFDPPLQTEFARLQLRISQNRALFDRASIAGYVGSINSEPWAGFPERAVKCTDIQATRAFENGYFYWKCSWTFEVKQSRWNPVKILNAGYREKNAANSTGYLRITDDSGAPVSRPYPLDASGNKVTRAAIAANRNTAIIFLKYHPYDEVDFRDLLLF